MKIKKNYPIGTMFGYMEIIGEPISVTKGNQTKIKEKCRCTLCGTEKYVARAKLVSGNTKTCGGKGCRSIFYKANLDVWNKSKHGMWGTRIYNIYKGIKARCNKKSCKAYNYYGGKGIKCEWNSFEEFYKDMWENYKEHCEKYGENDTTLDRIDSNGNYCKENCRWATYKEQANNRSNNYSIMYKGKAYKSISDLCDDKGLKYHLIIDRLRLGWDIGKAIETPQNIMHKEIMYKGKKYYSISELSREKGISHQALSRKIIKGLNVDNAVETIISNKNKGH